MIMIWMGVMGQLIAKEHPAVAIATGHSQVDYRRHLKRSKSGSYSNLHEEGGRAVVSWFFCCSKSHPLKWLEQTEIGRGGGMSE